MRCLVRFVNRVRYLRLPASIYVSFGFDSPHLLDNVYFMCVLDTSMLYKRAFGKGLEVATFYKSVEIELSVFWRFLIHRVQICLHRLINLLSQTLAV